jgi:hypothetical protein
MLKNKKLLILLSCAAAGLLVVVIFAAVIIGVVRRADDDFLELAEKKPYDEITAEKLSLKEEDLSDLPIAPTALGLLSIKALDNTDFGISTDTKFLISSDELTLTAEHLNSYLSLRSGEAFTLEENDDNTFLLQLPEEAQSNSLVNFVYQPTGYSAANFAFQTADTFRVTATTPAHNTRGIPNNSGIEVTFNQELAGGIAAFEEAFTIEPAVSGRFHMRGTTYIFAPPNLAFNTTYTVTVSQELLGAAGDTLGENHVFSFSTQWGTARTPLFSVSGSAYETFLPWNEVFIALDYSRDFHGKNFTVNLYDLKNAENFINFSGTDSAELLKEYELEVQIFEGDWRQYHYLFLGETLPEGYYVAEIRSTERNVDIVAHKFIQVSPVSVYSISVDKESVFWVHDASTGEPARNARINVGGTTTRTNNEGIATINTRADSRAMITIDYADYLPFAYFKPTFSARTLIPTDRFLSYMYTDRPTYRPNDSIDVFGVILPRYGHSHNENDVFTLRIGNMIQLPVILDSFNSFAISIPVTNMHGHASITVEVNGERLMASHINFLDYTNLTYVLSGKLDRLAYEPGDFAQAEISVATFAGRPAVGVGLNIRDENIPNLRADENGIASGSLPMPSGSGVRGWHPYWDSFWYTVTGDAQSSQSISLPYIYVPRNVMLENELSDGTMTVTTNEICVEKINELHSSRRWSHLSPDVFRGAPIDIDFQIRVTRHVTTRTIRSQQYDHINRRTVTTYNHDTKNEENYRIVNARTVNGSAVVTGLPTSDDPLIRYSMEIHYRDTNGRETCVWVWASSSWSVENDTSSIRHFNFSVANQNLRIGETTQVSLYESSNPYYYWWNPDNSTRVTDGRLLTVLVRDGVLSVRAGSPRGVPITFTEAGISNAIVYGAYFDGKFIFPIEQPIILTYDFTEREIDIDLNFDKEIYRPGDEVTLDINSAPNAQVLISVVDESAIQNSWHAANFLSRLYRSSEVWWWGGNFHQFSSHRQHNFGGGGYGAEEGGGDGDYDPLTFRDQFIDNPIFEIVQLDARGNGKITFTLPHQITSWRVTAIALTENGFGGDVRENIISSLDFYVDLINTNEYITGDDIAAVVRAYGASSVDFVFNVLQNDEIIFTDTQTNTSGRAVFNAGKLPIGEYSMQIRATAGSHRDAVELPFTVVESALIIRSHVSGDISDFDFGNLNMRELPVRISFMNANIRPLAGIVNNAANSRSFRTDHIAAAAFADYFYTGETDVYAVRSQVHAESGGIPELIYEDANLAYTARFAACFPEYVNRGQIINYLNGFDDSVSAEGRASILLALAAVGEPVLLQLRNEAAAINPSNTTSVLYLAAALVAIGDDAGAKELMEQITIPQNPSVSVHSETINTLLFFINTAIDPDAAWRYIRRRNINRYVSDVPERINFVRRVRLLGATVSEFEYFHEGETHTARLENFERLSLHLSGEQFAALNITPTVGDTKFHLHYYGYDSSNWSNNANTIRITRRIDPDGDLFRVTFVVTLPCYGSYTIYDRLPSNMRFVPFRHTNHNHGFARNTQRQLVELNFWDLNPHLPRTLVYHAMELYEADMSPGTTYITNFSQTAWGSTR